MLSRVKTALVAGILLSAPIAAQYGPQLPYESLHVTPGDYRNVRGFNYIAVYPSLNKIGNVVNGSVEWMGVTSPTVMWENYDPEGTTGDEVHKQLWTLKQIGVNTIRVFMSYPCWLHHEEYATRHNTSNAYNKRIADFFARCRHTGLKCVVVLWDNTAIGNLHEPRYGGPNDYFSENLFQFWHSNPGLTQLNKLLLKGGGSFAGTPAETYLQDIVAAAQTTDSVAVFEVINEPFALVDPVLGQVIGGTTQVVDAATSTPIMLGLPYWDHSMHVHARRPEIDILAIHHYAFYATTAALESQVYNATHIRLDPNQGTALPVMHKPLLLGENGSPGTGHAYTDAFDQAADVPRVDLGPTETGIGFLSFSAMVGWQHGNYPFKHEGGMLYGDGTVRDLSVVQHLRNAAGLPASTLLEKSSGPTPACPQNQPAKLDNPPRAGFVLQGPVSRDNDSYADRVAWMNATPLDFAAVGQVSGCAPHFGAYIELREVFSMAYQSVTAAHDLAILWNATASFVSPPGLANGNQYASAGTAPPDFVMPIATRNSIDAHIAATALQLDGNGDFVPTPFTNNLLSQSSVGPPFDPRIHAEHLALLCVNVFDPWRVMMRDYVIAQQ